MKATLVGGPYDGKIVEVSNDLTMFQRPIITNHRVTKIAKYIRCDDDTSQFKFEGYM